MKKTSFFFSLVLFAASMTPLAHAQLMPATSAGGQRAAAVKITPMSAADVTTIVNTGIGNGNVVIPGNGVKAWTTYFVGMSKTAREYDVATSMNAIINPTSSHYIAGSFFSAWSSNYTVVKIGSDNHIYVSFTGGAHSGWVDLGEPIGNNPVAARFINSCDITFLEFRPVGNMASGSNPTSWTMLQKGDNDNNCGGSGGNAY